MATCVLSPRGGIFSDEEEAGVFESTAAESGQRGGAGPQIPELSVIAPPLDTTKLGAGGRSCSQEAAERVQVFLRIRPLTKKEQEEGEDQGCVCVESEDTLLLRAPKDSFTMRNTERGVGQSLHKFTFTQISGPDTSQSQFFERTLRGAVREVLQGHSRLFYTYGVTNSGKTYTIQGSGSEGGLLPRALVAVFGGVGEHLHPTPDLKPVLSQEVRWLDGGEVRAEELRRAALLREEECQTPQRSRVRGGWGQSSDSGIAGLSTHSYSATQLEDSDSVSVDLEGLSQGSVHDDGGKSYSVWVSFFEIYNEFLYDLLDTPAGHGHKRATLRLCDDRHGNPYVKDLTWVNVRSAEEAWRVLQVGRRNQSFASTHLNRASSRSHSIFSMRVLHIDPEARDGQGVKISELSLCDLAGSERSNGQSCGERMKEANSINTSLHTLGRCLSALRHNQTHRSRPPQVVPFRDSKLTRVFQAFFCGRGHCSMIVNVSPCAGTYDETLQALKFSAIATQLVHAPPTKTRVAYIQSLLREHGLKTNESVSEVQEDELGDESDEEGDVTMFDSEALLRAIEVLKEMVVRERRERAELEATLREQVCTEMMELLTQREEDFSETLESERALMEERYENKIENLQNSLRRYYSQEIEERDEQIEELTAALQEKERGKPKREEGKERESSVPETLETAAPSTSGPRRSHRLATLSTSSCSSSSTSSSSTSISLSLEEELARVHSELERCRAELRLKTQELEQCHMLARPPPTEGTLITGAERKLEEGQKSLRLLRDELSGLRAGLQAAGRACCRNTGGERLRGTLGTCHNILTKQEQTLSELQNHLLLVRLELQRRPERPPLPPSSSCKKRGCGGGGESENLHPEKKPFLRGLFPSRAAPATPSSTPYGRILRSRQRSPGPAPLKF
ncbi:kinesin-like protein KIF20A [Amia ocellicauda]|uniref:kinesin-like protein KIF20A n=1 Tax=Amia ocellicauda TaxID=2972642 RepID=UPI003463B43C